MEKKKTKKKNNFSYVKRKPSKQTLKNGRIIEIPVPIEAEYSILFENEYICHIPHYVPNGENLANKITFLLNENSISC